MKLESPREEFADSYRSFVDEVRRSGESFVPFTVGYPVDDFGAFLRRLRDCAAGSEIAGGFVAHETFWLVDERARVVGVSNLRHCLTKALLKDGGHIGYGIRPSARRKGHATLILKETLLRAKERGIAKALLTCYKGNVGSAKTILNNGGVLDSEELLPGQTDFKQRYWIALP
jgi:predicted acetyltransferase